MVKQKSKPLTTTTTTTLSQTQMPPRTKEQQWKTKHKKNQIKHQARGKPPLALYNYKSKFEYTFMSQKPYFVWKTVKSSHTTDIVSGKRGRTDQIRLDQILFQYQILFQVNRKIEDRQMREQSRRIGVYFSRCDRRPIRIVNEFSLFQKFRVIEWEVTWIAIGKRQLLGVEIDLNVILNNIDIGIMDPH